MALVRASYEENPLAVAGRKVRYLCDLHQLASQAEVAILLASPGLTQ